MSEEDKTMMAAKLLLTMADNTIKSLETQLAAAKESLREQHENQLDLLEMVVTLQSTIRQIHTKNYQLRTKEILIMEIIKPIKEKKSVLLIKDAPFGVALKRASDKSTILRVKPTSFILNSTLVADVRNRADVFIVNLVTGTLFSIQGTEEVEVLNAKIVIE